ncbi:hypothetical protein CYMTET_19557 [Cymbomonas tetramitiformis]|uniref:Mutator-like transposase domain-containing protein n=1 Tax=Cymbomonas tetramitiformis TaxID=36881 RepID=A0AAE0G5U9_9CHLO|nr:hypothetical protein CYMTET_19557 [Cymbomonas tetramitiformis]
MLPSVTSEYEPHITNFGLASIIHLRCTYCPFTERSTTLETSSKVSSTYEVNTLHVLGEQTAGLAPTKVEKLFTTLGVDYTLHKTAHGSIQKRVGSEVEIMAKASCEKAFENEVITTMENVDRIEHSDGKDTVQLSVTGDCAWPTRGSGHSYASICGGFILMGAIHKKIISAAIFSKMCTVCENAEKEAVKQSKEPVYPEHDCFRGCRGIMADSDHLWRGSSKAMEPKGALCTALGLGKHCFTRDVLKAIVARIRYFTADEDSNMIAALNSALMPAWLRPVDKLSDPNHMQQIQYKLLEALRVKEKWKGGTLSKAVIDYLNRMYRYIIKSVAAKEDLEWALPEDEKVEWLSGAVMNVIDHAFGKHEHCGRYRVPLPDGTWHSWCGVDANDPDYKPHLPHGKFLNPNEPHGYYEKVKEVFASRLAKKEIALIWPFVFPVSIIGQSGRMGLWRTLMCLLAALAQQAVAQSPAYQPGETVHRDSFMRSGSRLVLQATALSVTPTSSPVTPSPSTSATSLPPTAAPTASPVTANPPTAVPTTFPPTTSPSTLRPTSSPSTRAPSTASPITITPSAAPTTVSPSTSSPTTAPTSHAPTRSPSTVAPTLTPTTLPTTAPTSRTPTSSPSTVAPTLTPTTLTPTTQEPTNAPSTLEPATSLPTGAPATRPPTLAPSTGHPTTTTPTSSPSTFAPTAPPTSLAPTSSAPTEPPTTAGPTMTPSTETPSSPPTAPPSTRGPTFSPSVPPTSSTPTSTPTLAPTITPTITRNPSATPTTLHPTVSPSTAAPSVTTAAPTRSPTAPPATLSPTLTPTTSPTTSSPSSGAPTHSPVTAMPSSVPTHAPSTLFSTGAVTNITECFQDSLWWRAPLSDSSIFHRCLPDLCRGVEKLEDVADQLCATDAAPLCRTGHTGVMCAVCNGSHVAHPSGQCTECTADLAKSPFLQLVFWVLVSTASAAGVFYVLWSEYLGSLFDEARLIGQQEGPAPAAHLEARKIVVSPQLSSPDTPQTAGAPRVSPRWAVSREDLATEAQRVEEGQESSKESPQTGRSTAAPQAAEKRDSAAEDVKGSQHGDSVCCRPGDDGPCYETMKLLVGFAQLVGWQRARLVQVPWPPHFSAAAGWLAVANLDPFGLPGVPCLFLGAGASSLAHVQLALAALLPFVLALLVFLHHTFAKHLHSGSASPAVAAAFWRFQERCWACSLLSIVLCAPAAVGGALRMFSWRHVDGNCYLATELATECLTPLHVTYMLVAAGVMSLYGLAVPAVLVVLYRHHGVAGTAREHLASIPFRSAAQGRGTAAWWGTWRVQGLPTDGSGNKLRGGQDAQDPWDPSRTAQLACMVAGYRAGCWGYELVQFGCRIVVFTVLCFPGPTGHQALTTMCILLAMAVMLVHMSPHRRGEDAITARLTAFGGCMVAYVATLEEEGLTPEAMTGAIDTILVLVVVAVFGYPAARHLLRVVRKGRHQRLLPKTKLPSAPPAAEDTSHPKESAPAATGVNTTENDPDMQSILSGRSPVPFEEPVISPIRVSTSCGDLENNFVSPSWVAVENIDAIADDANGESSDNHFGQDFSGDPIENIGVDGESSDNHSGHDFNGDPKENIVVDDHLDIDVIGEHHDASEGYRDRYIDLNPDLDWSVQ